MTKDSTTKEDANRSYHEAQSRMALLPNYYRWYLRHFHNDITGTGCILGVGAGYELQDMLPLSRGLVAVDYNEELLRRLTERIHDKRLTTLCLDLRADWSELGNSRFDYVAAFDVLEHFENDKEFLTKCFSLLKPGGKLLLKVPACSDLFSNMDEASGHFRRYDKNALAALLQSCGFSPQKLRHINPLGALAYRRRKHQSRNFSKSFQPRTLRLVNQVLPLLSLFDVLTPVFRGLSLIAVAEKPKVQ